jgi:hypothetical protein
VEAKLTNNGTPSNLLEKFLIAEISQLERLQKMRPNKEGINEITKFTILLNMKHLLWVGSVIHKLHSHHSLTLLPVLCFFTALFGI